NCGLKIDRDVNAARNVLRRAGQVLINAFGHHVRPKYQESLLIQKLGRMDEQGTRRGESSKTTDAGSPLL
ncbi:hypothetical protein HY498_05710, partial [Candidatus Woesearchaeota archaeon]|nr:hypothetical protein [Candidatus Woesearchaeota archaeon]